MASGDYRFVGAGEVRKAEAGFSFAYERVAEPGQ